MEERNESNDKFDEELPGFRFHPTDEELVGFYLTRKIQKKPLSIELIKQIDIYKYDPWDLPKLATNGEKEWYFYCPRDRKYRNSTRPNRVTGAGFWKATGTDRPIYSSESSKCIGLKKSLVFYRGKAAKGIKTDWMMHEFRLPSLSHSSSSPSTNKNIPINEAWAICRIFKKANSNTKRGLSHSWVNPVFNSTKSDIMNPSYDLKTSSSILTIANKANPSLRFGFCDDLEQSSFSSFSPPYFPPNNEDNQFKASCYTSSSIEKASTPASRSVVNDATSLLLDMSTSILGDFGANMELGASFNGFLDVASEDMQRNLGYGEGEGEVSLEGKNVGEIDEKWMEFPYGFASNSNLNFIWDSSPCPSDFSTNFSTNKCYS